jgi:DNA polymerase V
MALPSVQPYGPYKNRSAAVTSNFVTLFQTYNSPTEAVFSSVPVPTTCVPPDESPVKVGFASPAESTTQASLNLHTHLVRHPLATFFVRNSGDAMSGARLYDGTLLVVDRAEAVFPGNLVLAVVNGEFHVRRLETNQGAVRLCATHPAYDDIELTPEDQWEIWGRVIYSINQH